jgi:hypothetical protein
LTELAEDVEEVPPPPDANGMWDLWERRLGLYQSSRLWQPAWGPRPGQPGCEVPAGMLGGAEAAR